MTGSTNLFLYNPRRSLKRESQVLALINFGKVINNVYGNGNCYLQCFSLSVFFLINKSSNVFVYVTGVWLFREGAYQIGITCVHIAC